MMKSNDQREKMFALCREWEESGKKREAFCREHNINLGKFAYWRTQFLSEHQSSPAGGFVPIVPGMPAGMEIRYPNGVVLKVPDGTPVSQLKGLICLI